MINSQYHKGELCKIKLVLCQEGYCGHCHIYEEWQRGLKRGSGDPLMTSEKPNNIGQPLK
jgi:hypothetical protein